MGSVPRVLTGIAESWGPTEQVIDHPNFVESVGFSPDGTHVASGANDGIIRIWNVATGELEVVLHDARVWWDASVMCVAFSTDGTHVVSGSIDKTVRVWNLATGDVEHVLKGHLSEVKSVAYSHDSTCVVSGSVDGGVCIWNAVTGVIERVLEGHSRWPAVAFSPDGTHVVSGSADKTVRIWNVGTGDMEHVLEDDSYGTVSVAYSHDSTRVMSVSKRVRVWNAVTGEMVHGLESHVDHDGWSSIALSADGTRVASGGFHSVCVWNAVTGEIERVLQGYAATSVAISPDGTRVVSGSRAKLLRIWNAVSGAMECGTRVVSGSNDNSARIWNAVTGEMDCHSDEVTSVAFSRDGTRVVSRSGDDSVRIWNAATGEIERVLYCSRYSLDALDDVPDSADTSSLFMLHDGNILCLQNHPPVTSIRSSRDGTHIISGSNDGSVWIWPTVTRGVEPVLLTHAYHEDEDEEYSVEFLGDGTHVISGSHSAVLAWDPISRGSTSLPCHESFQFPDGSRVTHILPGEFQLFPPDQHQRGVDSDPDDAEVDSDPDEPQEDSDLGEPEVVSDPDEPQEDSDLGEPEVVSDSDQPEVVSDPEEPWVVLSPDCKWILTGWPGVACWIPPEFRDDDLELVVYGTKVCFGCGSGRVIIIDLTPPH